MKSNKLYTQLLKILLLFSVVWFIACTSNTIYPKPKDLLSKEQMIDIMTDLYIAKSAYHVKNINEERKINYTPLVFEQYGIDSARFSRSNKYYMSKLDEYEKMHKTVADRIDQMKVTMDSIPINKEAVEFQKKQKK